MTVGHEPARIVTCSVPTCGDVLRVTDRREILLPYVCDVCQARALKRLERAEGAEVKRMKHGG